MPVNAAANRYVRWLYRYASSRPDLALLARVAGAVAVLEDRPEDLAAVLRDELAIAMADVAEARPELAIAMAATRGPSVTDRPRSAWAGRSLAGQIGFGPRWRIYLIRRSCRR